MLEGCYCERLILKDKLVSTATNFFNFLQCNVYQCYAIKNLVSMCSHIYLITFHPTKCIKCLRN